MIYLGHATEILNFEISFMVFASALFQTGSALCTALLRGFGFGQILLGRLVINFLLPVLIFVFLSSLYGVMYHCN